MELTATVTAIMAIMSFGFLAAVILGISRAIGETMVVAIAAGGTGGSLRTINLLGPGQTMTGAISSLAVARWGERFGRRRSYVFLLALKIPNFGRRVFAEGARMREDLEGTV